MKSIITVITVLFLLAGCAGQFPACNDKYDPEAKLVKIAMEKKVCLDDVGTALILANGTNISLANLYTAEQALMAVDLWISALGKKITDIKFSELVYSHIKHFPELILITDSFKLGFNTGEVIDQSTRNMLQKYLTDRVRPILVARIQ